jgi:HD-like signal output (HDOD) protein
LVLSIGVSTVIPGCPTQSYDRDRFWRAAARRGVLAQSLASITHPARKSECFTAGFLQDMAVPFLACRRPEEYGPVLEQWHNDGGCLASMERENFEWDHAEVASWLCSEWELPENLAAAIGGHHGARLGDHENLPPVTLVASLGEVDSSSGLEALVEKAHSSYGLSADKLQTLVESSLEDADELTRLLG